MTYLSAARELLSHGIGQVLSSPGDLCRSSQEHESFNLWECGLGKRRKDSQCEGTKYREEKGVER